MARRDDHDQRMPGNTIVYVGDRKPNQLPFLVRALWFLFLGWWLALSWISVAIVFAVTIIGLPIATWMFERTNAVMTLQQR